MTRPVIKVGISGKASDGEEFDHAAIPEMVNAGYMINRPVILEYPDGVRVTGNQVRITPAGMDFFRRTVPLEIRNTAGEA